MNKILVALSAFVLVACAGPDGTIVREYPGPAPTQKAATAEVSSKSDQAETAEEKKGATDAVDDAADVEPTPKFVRITTPLFEESPGSIEFKKTTWAVATPFADGGRLGLVSGNTPIAIKSHVINDDCETPWIEVAPRGFVCMEVGPARKSKKSKKSKKPKKSKKRRAMRSSYAITAKGARFFKSIKSIEAGKTGRPARGDMLRLGKSVKLEDGRVFRKTDRGEYIAATDIRRLWGSKFAGTKLPPTLSSPVAFAVNARSVKGKVKARREPSAKARVAKRIKPRSLVTILEISDDELFARVGEGQWVDRRNLREIELKSPPAEVAEGLSQTWVDVDLDKQLVVVYEGKKPIFATLASTGREKDRTPTGVFRVTRKKKRTTMRSDRSRRQTYSAAVPWATYFYEGTAFHTAYWHDSFGKSRSHGCVNLSPSDALTIYDLLAPEVPQGWSVVYGHESQLGSVVQVHSVRPNPVPDPEADPEAVASKNSAKN